MSQTRLYKALKHKTLEDTYGAFVDIGLQAAEMGDINIPQLMPPEASMERLVTELERNPANKYLIKQLKDYKMVTIEVRVLDSPIEYGNTTIG